MYYCNKLFGMRLLVAAAPLLAAAKVSLNSRWGELETLPGPSSPAAQPAWLANLTQYRATTIAQIGFDPSLYNKYNVWKTSMIVAPQSHLYDRFLFDSASGLWTVDKFLDDLNNRYGGIDGVLLWASYPNMGVDERNQFQLLEDMPGGLAGLQTAISRFHARGVKAGLPYNPWDTDTARLNITDELAIAQYGATVNADFVNGDTMNFMDSAFFQDSITAGHPIALQPEGGPVPTSLNWTTMGWGYWDDVFIPQIDNWKWLTTGVAEYPHQTYICDRWSQNHTTDLHQAWFNGLGFVSWENVWGIWNGMNERDSEATRRYSTMARFFSGFLIAAGWEPHTPLYPDAATVGVFASRWPQPAGAVYNGNATLWTIVNRGSIDYNGPVVYVPCAASGVSYYDIYRGTAVSAQAVANPTGACAVSLPVEGGGFSGLLAIYSSDVNTDLTTYLQAISALTATPLASYSTDHVYLPQVMNTIQPTTPAGVAPAGMVLVQGNASWTFTVAGTEIEGGEGAGVDVQFPWESVCVKVHAPHTMSVPTFYMDIEPVTNAQYQVFLEASGYSPVEAHNYLRDWSCSGGVGSGSGCTVPSGAENKPVTWVDLRDSAAYCNYYGKRLPNDWEWQYAAQGADDSRLYPWGSTWDASKVPPQSHGAVRPLPPDVGQYPQGSSMAGVQDLMGLVWQWTNEFVDDHTRTGLVRGGAYYRATSSSWYFPGDLSPAGDVRANTHNKLLLMWPSYDRHGTVGFRCVMDAVQ